MESVKTTISELHSKESYHYAVYHKIHRFRCVQRKISVAIADEGQAKPRYYGSIAHTPAALRKLIKSLGLHIPCPSAMRPVRQVTKLTAGLNLWGHIVWSSLLPSSPNVQETG